MSTRQPLLTGAVEEPEDRFEQLQAEMEELREQFATARHEIKREALVALLGILTSAMREVASGKYDLDSIRTTAEVGVDARVAKVWESWKTKMPGYPTSMIEALLLHGELSAAQLRVHMKCANQTVYDTAVKLNKAGLIHKNGGRYSLKSL